MPTEKTKKKYDLVLKCQANKNWKWSLVHLHSKQVLCRSCLSYTTKHNAKRAAKRALLGLEDAIEHN